ncbi:hypothetical protein [Wolbachia endosymbiont of Ctenocephalides felis wCfeT]|nr:hypothetical protein [Wolbachia endosymbiont of Ctenocephalides felis wCfeT]
MGLFNKRFGTLEEEEKGRINKAINNILLEKANRRLFATIGGGI